MRVYDHRKGKIVKIFENLHEGRIHRVFQQNPFINFLGFINSVGWNSDGNLLMSASIHGAVKVVDFKRDCEITYSGKTTDGGKNIYIDYWFLILMQRKQILAFSWKTNNDIELQRVKKE